MIEIEAAQQQMRIGDREIVPFIAGRNDALKERLCFGKLAPGEQAQPGCIHFDELYGQAADFAGEQAALYQGRFGLHKVTCPG